MEQKIEQARELLKELEFDKKSAFEKARRFLAIQDSLRKMSMQDKN